MAESGSGAVAPEGTPLHAEASCARPVAREAADTIILAVVYLAAAKFSLHYAVIHPSAAPVWPPTGIALAGLLLLGLRAWPGIFAAAFLVNVTTDGTVWTSAAIATGNTLEAVLGAALVTRFARGRRAIERIEDVFAFIGLAAFASTTLSATIGVASLALGGFAAWPRFGGIWLTWWLGDAAGALIAAPLILLWAQPRPLRWDPRALPERALFLLAFATLAWIMFGERAPLSYLAMPILVWSAYRFDPRETATVTALLAMLALYSTRTGVGPFAGADPHRFQLALQGFAAIVVLVALPFATLVAQGRAADLERRRREEADRLMAHAGTLLGASLDPAETLRAIAELTVPALADWCTIHLVDKDGRIRRLTMAHRDPARAGIAAELESRVPPPQEARYGAPEVIRTRRPQLVPEVTDSVLLGAIPGPRGRALVRDVGIRSAIIVPLLAGDRTLGAITLLTAESGRRYDQQDLALAQELAHRAATAVENAGSHEAAQVERAEAERQALRIQRLQSITASLSEALTPAQVADVVLRHVRDEVGASGAAVSLLAPDGETLVFLSAVGYPADLTERWRRSPSDVRPLQEAVRTGRAVWYATWDDFLARYPKALPPGEPARRGARAAVPLMLHGRPMGGLYMNFEEARAFGAAEIEFLLTLGRLCAQACDRARLYAAEKRAHEVAERSAQQLQRLQSVTAALSGALTPAEMAAVILTEGGGALRARAGVLYRLSAETNDLEMLHATGYPAEIAAQWTRTPLGSASISGDVAVTGRPRYFASREEVLAQYPALAGKINRAAGARAFVPLLLHRQVTGVLGFVFEEARPISEDERAFLQALAYSCGQALERSRLYEAQRAVADTLQRAFLPVALPDVPGVAISAAYLPAATESTVGGDWYDAFALPDGRIALSVGDAVGHGLQAAVVMGLMRQTIRAAALDDSDPASVLVKANRVLVHSHGARTMATALFAVLDPASLVLAYASAGHPPPMLRHAAGRVAKLTGGTLPLGIVNAIAPETHSIRLDPGTRLVLYTDGLVELTRNIDDGEAVLRAAVEAAPPKTRDAAQTILSAVVGSRAPADDIAIVALGIDAGPFECFRVTVPAEPEASRAVRRTLRRLAAALHLGAAAFTGLELAVGEAVNNAVEHAYGSSHGTVEVRARRDGDRLRIEVADRGRWRAERDEGRGHGLIIMRRMVDEVHVERSPTGTTVRLELDLRRAAEGEAAGGPGPEIGAAPGARSRSWPALPDGDVRLQQVSAEAGGPVPVVELSGAVDMEDEDGFVRRLEEAARRDRRAVVVSLAGVSYIDSRRVHALLGFGARLAVNRGALLLVAPRASLAGRLLEIMGASSAYPVYETVEEALAEFRKLGAPAP